MRSIFLSIALLVVFNSNSVAQGCVAIRSTGGFCTASQASHTDTASHEWLLNVNNRYYRSFRHFIGTAEQKQRQVQGTEVINYVDNADFALTRIINKWWSVTVD